MDNDSAKKKDSKKEEKLFGLSVDEYSKISELLGHIFGYVVRTLFL